MVHFFLLHVGLKQVQDKLNHHQKIGFKYVDHKDCSCLSFSTEWKLFFPAVAWPRMK